VGNYQKQGYNTAGFDEYLVGSSLGGEAASDDSWSTVDVITMDNE